MKDLKELRTYRLFLHTLMALALVVAATGTYGVFHWSSAHHRAQVASVHRRWHERSAVITALGPVQGANRALAFQEANLAYQDWHHEPQVREALIGYGHKVGEHHELWVNPAGVTRLAMNGEGIGLGRASDTPELTFGAGIVALIGLMVVFIPCMVELEDVNADIRRCEFHAVTDQQAA